MAKPGDPPAGYLVHFFNSGAPDPYAHCPQASFDSHVGVAPEVVTCPSCCKYMKNQTRKKVKAHGQDRPPKLP